MAEQSYFQRKFYANKFKRTKVASADAEADPAKPAPRRSLSNGARQESADSAIASPDDDGGHQRAAAAATSHSDLQHSNRSSDCDQAGEQNHDEQDQNGAAAASGAEEPPARPSAPPDPDDHIETLNFHPDAERATEPRESKANKKESKLSKATRAILLFRRATSPLGGGGHDGGAARTRPGGYRHSRSFVASFWSRQNTADMARSASREDSLASSSPANNRSQPSLAAFLSGGGASSGRDEAAANRSNLSASSSFSLPRFIVPKMNALKLPIVCLIKSLDDELMREIFIHRYELGQYLIDNLKVSLNMKDEKYFGLKMADSLEEQEDVRKPWLDLNETVYKQIGRHGRLTARAGPDQGAGDPARAATFYLRLKFYPPNLARVQDQFHRHYLWLQLRRDLRLGKLTSSMNNLTYLMACVLQFELGDFSNELVNQRLPSMNILPNQDLIEQQAIETWQNQMAGVKRHLVQMQFLRASVILETYGFDYYPVRDHQRQRAYLLGFNYAGVKTIRNGRITNHFRWHNLSKISYERRMIIFHIYPNENSKRKQILGFKCLSNEECQNLYLRLLEQKYFFTVDLTYFDKSVRHPSHLQELAATGSLQLEQQANGEWPPAGRLEDYFGAAGFDELHERDESGPTATSRPDQSRAETVLAASQQRGGGGLDEAADALTQRRLSFQRHKTLPESGESAATGSTLDSPLEWHAHQAQWSQPPPPPPPSRGGQTVSRRAPPIKSDSLQEPPSHSDPPGYEHSDCFSQPSSPSLPEYTCCAATARPLTLGPAQVQPYSCCATGPRDDGPPLGATHQQQQQQQQQQQPEHHSSGHPAQLERQCSFAKYSPDCDFDPRDKQRNSCPSGELTLDAQLEASGSRRPFAATPNSVQKRPATACERLAHWAEQILVQPAALLSQPNVLPVAPGQQTASANGDILMQIVRLCLLILLLNLMVRVSDGISNALMELLSFGQPSSASAGKLFAGSAEQ